MKKIFLETLNGVLLFTLLIMGLTGCSASQTASTDSDGSTTSDFTNNDSRSSDGTPQQGARIASSFADYIDYWLKNPNLDPPLSQQQRTVLETAKQSGELSISAYEQSWSQYKSCMLDKGYKEILLNRYSNGMLVEARHIGGTAKQEEKYGRDRNSCFNTYVMYIQDVFGTQKGNPNYYSSTAEGFVDCLKRNNLVDQQYTAEQYRQEAQAGKGYSYDTTNAEARSCEVANYIFRSTENDPTEQLW